MKALIVFLIAGVLGGCAGVTFHMPSPIPPGTYVERTVSPSGGVTTTTYSYQPTCWSCYAPMYSPPVYFYWGRF